MNVRLVGKKIALLKKIIKVYVPVRKVLKPFVPSQQISVVDDETYHTFALFSIKSLPLEEVARNICKKREIT